MHAVDGAQVNVTAFQALGMRALGQPIPGAGVGVNSYDGSNIEFGVLSLGYIYGSGLDAINGGFIRINDSFDINDITVASGANRGRSALHVTTGGQIYAAAPEIYRSGYKPWIYRLTNSLKNCTNTAPNNIIGSTSTAAIGISIGGKFYSGREVLFNNNDFNMLSSGDGYFSMPMQTGAISNVLSVTADGALNSVYPLQTLEGGLRTITMNPGAQSTVENVFGIYWNPDLGPKTYTLMSKFAAAHELTLSGGAFFIGAGGANGTTNNKATFAATIGAFLRFQVISLTQVLVLDQSGITFSP